MENKIPNTFDNYQERRLARGIETMSETEYKGYIIRLRCYEGSGIWGKIIKVLDNGKRLQLRERGYNFMIPIVFLNQLKNYIDNHEINLINKIKKHMSNTPKLD